MTLFTMYHSTKFAVTSRTEMRQSVDNLSRNLATSVEIDWAQDRATSSSTKYAPRCCGTAHKVKEDSSGIVATRWIALHDSIHFISDLVYELHALWKAEGARFLATQGGFNNHYAVTLLLENNEYRGFIMYLVVYLTFQPDVFKASQIHKETFLAKFKEAESFKSVLESVTINQLAEIAPLMIKYFGIPTHLYNDKVKWTFFPERCSEDFWEDFEDDELPDDALNLTEFKPDSKRKIDDPDDPDASKNSNWLNLQYQSMHITKDNTYVAYAAGVIHKDMENLCEFMLRRHFFQYVSHTKFNSYTAAITVLQESMEIMHLDLFKHFHEKANHVPISKSDKGSLMGEIHWVKNLSSVGTQRLENMLAHVEAQQIEILDIEEEEDQPYKPKAGRCISTFWQKMFHFSIFEKALLSFVFQVLLYFAAISVNEEEQDGAILIVIIFIAIFFNLVYGLEVALSEFVLNSTIEFFSARSLAIKSLIGFNMIANVWLPALLPFPAAFILQSGDSLIDCILNSVAIMFIVELDDILISDIDCHVLGDKVLYSYIGILHELGVSKKKKTFTRHLRVESVVVYMVALCSLVSIIASLTLFGPTSNILT